LTDPLFTFPDQMRGQMAMDTDPGPVRIEVHAARWKAKARAAELRRDPRYADAWHVLGRDGFAVYVVRA
jgi:hypothetical protein